MLSRMTHRHIVAIDLALIVWVLFCLMLGIEQRNASTISGALGDGLVSAGKSISGWAAGGRSSSTPIIGGTSARSQTRSMRSACRRRSRAGTGRPPCGGRRCGAAPPFPCFRRCRSSPHGFWPGSPSSANAPA